VSVLSYARMDAPENPQSSEMLTIVSRVAESNRRTLASSVSTVVAGSIALCFANAIFGTTAQADVDFNRDIRPILAEHCFACHGTDSESREGDLRLDIREAAIESGAIVAGNPDDSELLSRLYTDDADLIMPPPAAKKPLADEQKDILKQWIAEGAEYQSHWAFMAPQRPELPEVHNDAWPKNAIDQFVLAQLEANSLPPAPAADARTLFRRLHLDITGLPPTPTDIDTFVNDMQTNSEQALSVWIDRLMESSAWGEHRARYWLDAARYGDTHGLHFDNYREMWPYRDWVIRAFNSNQPFDRFTVEQLAGDLLPDPSDDQLIATGFQRCNITTNEGGTIDEENLANYAADRVQTFGWVFLGLTTNCSQCHDHKFDPISMKDYYSLAAYFRNTTQQAKDGNVKDGKGPSIVVPSESDRDRWKALPAELKEARAQKQSRRKAAQTDFQQWLSTATAQTLEEQVPTQDLLASVPLNEGSGNQIANAADTAQLIQATGNVKWVPDGPLGSACVIAGDTTFDLGDIGDFGKDQGFSYGAWVKTSKKSGNGAILARMDVDAQHRGWDLLAHGDSYAVHIIDQWPGNAIKVVTPKKSGKPGTWQHVFVTYDGTAKPDGISIYLDGQPARLQVQTKTLKPDATIRTGTSLQIGQRSRQSVFDGGSIQDVRVYGRALSAAEVKAIAGLNSLQDALAASPDQRTAEQTTVLLNHYLNSADPEFPELTQTVARLEAEQRAIKDRSPVTHVQQERMDSMPVANLLVRGAYDKPGEELQAATPAALHPLPDNAARNRLGLADWVVTEENPLTARVTVNRFWQEIFGHGIVTTPEDFGVMGAPPSHPELLDWLAVEFRETGWDVKALFKMMLMSATYRQAALTTPEKLERDRDNVLLSRGPRFRMDAEMVRDYALASSGLLSRTMYGPGTKPYQPKGIWDVVGLPSGNTRNYVQDTGENLYRRTLYSFWKRMAPPPNMEAFNAPSREVCTVRRERTNTPLQALVTLNDPQFVEAARYLAQQVLDTGLTDESEILNQIAVRVLGRSLADDEQAVLVAAVSDLRNYYNSSPQDAEALINVGETRPNGRTDPVSLATWTMVCNQIMNLDEALCK